MTARFLLALLLQSIAAASVVTDVRSAIARNDFALGETHIRQYRQARGVTTELAAALSWLGRGALAARQFDKAEAYAVETHKLVLELLKKHSLASDRHLEIALGAAIEVQAHVMAERGERSGAVDFLNRQLAAYRNTPIRTRVQKNIHLLSLAGKPAPPLEMSEWLGPKPAPLVELKGRTVLLFFWAHWCGDCKHQGPMLARLKSEYGPKGLVLLAPTQLYGYTRRGQEAPPDEEMKYIDEIRRVHYPDLLDVSAPVSEDNIKNYGMSTTPTLVLIDRKGIVQMYHPGRISYDDLAAKVEAVLAGDPGT